MCVCVCYFRLAVQEMQNNARQGGVWAMTCNWVFGSSCLSLKDRDLESSTPDVVESEKPLPPPKSSRDEEREDCNDLICTYLLSASAARRALSGETSGLTDCTLGGGGEPRLHLREVEIGVWDR